MSRNVFDGAISWNKTAQLWLIADIIVINETQHYNTSNLCAVQSNVPLNRSMSGHVWDLFILLTSVHWCERQHMAADITRHSGPAGIQPAAEDGFWRDARRRRSTRVTDWRVTDAGPSNPVRPLCSSRLSASALGNGTPTECRLGPGELTDSDLTWFKELVNLYNVKAGGLLVYCVLIYIIWRRVGFEAASCVDGSVISFMLCFYTVSFCSAPERHVFGGYSWYCSMIISNHCDCGCMSFLDFIQIHLF